MVGPTSLIARHAALDPQPGQRARLLTAMTETVAAQGYAATTVADIVKAAGVSRTTFYEQFASKEECFLEAYSHVVDVLIDEVRRAVRGAGDAGWRAQLRAGSRAYLTALADDEATTRTYLLEVHAVGPAALPARADALRRFTERYQASFAAARAEDPSLPEPPAEALHVLCAGTEQLCISRVRAGEIASLRDLEETFCYCAEAVLLHRPTTDEGA